MLYGWSCSNDNNLKLIVQLNITWHNNVYFVSYWFIYISAIYLVFAFQKVKDVATGEVWTKPENLEQNRKRHSDEQDSRSQTEKQVKM